jgi:hypothetical protein
MAQFDEVPFGGLSLLLASERVPLPSAIEATNCYLDYDTITGRNGYRAILPTPPIIATSGGTVVTVTGTVSTITDPTLIPPILPIGGGGVDPVAVPAGGV